MAKVVQYRVIAVGWGKKWYVPKPAKPAPVRVRRRRRRIDPEAEALMIEARQR